MARAGIASARKRVTADPRCRFVNGDFFAMSSSVEGFDHRSQGRRFDAVLVDIDHSPRKLLHPRHAALYGRRGWPGSQAISTQGAFSRCGRTISPDDAFERVLAGAFATQASHA